MQVTPPQRFGVLHAPSARSQVSPEGQTVAAPAEHVPLAGSQMPAAWHLSDAVQVTPLQRLGALHTPSERSQVSPEGQTVAAPAEQTPVVESQTPAAWHLSEAVQATPLQRFGGTLHTPSARSQVSPEGQTVAAPVEHRPVLTSQVPALWHLSEVVQVTPPQRFTVDVSK